MSFEHDRQELQKWLRTVRAGRPPETRVVQQRIADELVATMPVADMRHVGDPVAWVVAGWHTYQAGIAGQYLRLEVVADRAMWILGVGILDNGSEVAMGILDVPILAGHAAPTHETYGTAPAVNRVAAGTNVAAPVATWPQQSSKAIGDGLPDGGVYVPRGKTFTAVAVPIASSWAPLGATVWWREIPRPGEEL